MTFFKGLCAQIGRSFTTTGPLYIDFRLSTGAKHDFNVIFSVILLLNNHYQFKIYFLLVLSTILK